MMLVPLEEQVTSLALSKRLAEAGLPVDTLFVWWGDESTPSICVRLQDTDRWCVEMERGRELDTSFTIPAYTVSELLKWLGTPMLICVEAGRVAVWQDLYNNLEITGDITLPEVLGELALKVKEGR